MLPYYGRGLERMKLFLGDIISLININHIPFKILEIGCGYGQVLLDLFLLYGYDVELHGINRSRGNGTFETVIKVGKYKGKLNLDSEFIKRIITIEYCDAGLGLPYSDGYFDLVISQMAIIYVRDKVKLIEDVSRVLAPAGFALLHTQFNRPELHAKQRYSIEILEKGKILELENFFSRFSNLRYERMNKGDVIVLEGGGHLNLGLKLIKSSKIIDHDPNILPAHLYGRRTVYKNNSINAEVEIF